MTSPASEKLRPSPPARYEELAQEHLENAALALVNDNALQASEEIWNAFAGATKAICQQRGWNHRYHNHLRAAASYLAEEWSRPDFHIAFSAFESLHINNYEHQRIVAEVIPILNLARDFCQELAQIRQTPPPDWNSLSSRQQQSMAHRLRELTRPLPDAAAFGPELTGADLDALPPVKPPHLRDA